jgi:glycosyltransferase involved in cell wall biosynthesis
VTLSTWPIVVFAHNEEDLIGACLETLLSEPIGDRHLAIYVLVNGCTDGTWAVVERFARRYPQVRPIHIELGDKNNAWNLFVHELCPDDAEIVFFMDGDMQVVRGSLEALKQRMDEAPEAQAIAALPYTGRTKDAFRDTIIRTHAIAGNLYALRGSLVRRFKEMQFRIPRHMFGDDGLLRTVILRDMDPSGPESPARITYTEEAGFFFQPYSIWKPSCWRRYRNRMRRYANRRLHNRMLYPHLLRDGLRALPADILDLAESELPKMRLEWNGLLTIFDAFALRRLRQRVERRRAQRAAGKLAARA